jgi:hypothetical protein
MDTLNLDEHDMWDDAFLSVEDGRWLGHLTRHPQPEPKDYASFEAYIKALIAHEHARIRTMPEGDR